MHANCDDGHGEAWFEKLLLPLLSDRPDLPRDVALGIAAHYLVAVEHYRAIMVEVHELRASRLSNLASRRWSASMRTSREAGRFGMIHGCCLGRSLDRVRQLLLRLGTATHGRAVPRLTARLVRTCAGRVQAPEALA